MTVRRKLVIWVVTLFTAVLITAGTVSVMALENQLVADVDQRLLERSEAIDQFVADGSDFPAPVRAPDTRFPAAQDMAVVVLDDTGTIVFSTPSGRNDQPDPLPDTSRLDPATAEPGTVREVDSIEDGGPTYRAVINTFDDSGSSIVLAIPLDGIRATMVSTSLTLFTVGVVAALTAGLLVWWVVRAGLRPIDEMIATAEQIADGDLSHRIDEVNPQTEIGQLATALNTMLGQIEEAVHVKSQSEERMRQFLSDASHELRTPLTSIRGYAELHHYGTATPEQVDRAFNRIEHEATRMARLVDDLLTLARLDQQRPLATRPVDITELVTEGVEAARIVDPKRPIELSTPADPVTTIGDETRLRQAIDNLLANVRHHTPPNTPTAVSLTATDRDVTIEVVDHGPGMTEDQAAHAFDRFYQANPEHTKGGTGLGLSIVKAVINGHGGTATMTTAPGQGAKVTLQIPRRGNDRSS